MSLWLALGERKKYAYPPAQFIYYLIISLHLVVYWYLKKLVILLNHFDGTFLDPLKICAWAQASLPHSRHSICLYTYICKCFYFVLDEHFVNINIRKAKGFFRGSTFSRLNTKKKKKLTHENGLSSVCKWHAYIFDTFFFGKKINGIQCKYRNTQHNVGKQVKREMIFKPFHPQTVSLAIVLSK